jgi:hypothetical protein
MSRACTIAAWAGILQPERVWPAGYVFFPICVFPAVGMGAFAASPGFPFALNSILIRNLLPFARVRQEWTVLIEHSIVL